MRIRYLCPSWVARICRAHARGLEKALDLEPGTMHVTLEAFGEFRGRWTPRSGQIVEASLGRVTFPTSSP